MSTKIKNTYLLCHKRALLWKQKCFHFGELHSTIIHVFETNSQNQFKTYEMEMEIEIGSGNEMI